MIPVEIHIEKLTHESLQDLLEKANIVASFLVGHRKILVDGGFPTDSAEVMCEAMHARLLGLTPTLFDSDEDDFSFLEVLGDDDEDG